MNHDYQSYCVLELTLRFCLSSPRPWTRHCSPSTPFIGKTIRPSQKRHLGLSEPPNGQRAFSESTSLSRSPTDHIRLCKDASLRRLMPNERFSMEIFSHLAHMCNPYLSLSLSLSLCVTRSPQSSQNSNADPPSPIISSPPSFLPSLGACFRLTPSPVDQFSRHLFAPSLEAC